MKNVNIEKTFKHCLKLKSSHQKCIFNQQRFKLKLFQFKIFSDNKLKSQNLSKFKSLNSPVSNQNQLDIITKLLCNLSFVQTDKKIFLTKSI